MSHVLESFIQILEQDQHHLNLDSRAEIESFLDKARRLRDYFPINSVDIRELEPRIRNIVHEAEDIIEVHITNHSNEKLDLTGVAEQVESINEEILNGDICISAVYRDSLLNILPFSNPAPSKKINFFVGRERDFPTLMSRIIQGPRQLQIIIMYGLLGAGKVTLARRLYNDSLITSHFDARVWVSAHLQPNVRSHLLSILEALGRGVFSSELLLQSDVQLGKLLKNSLKDRRYFIVIRDVRSLETWNKVRKFFPNDNKGCRLLLLIDEKGAEDDLGVIQGHEEAKCFGNTEPHKLDVLNPHDSWLLFCRCAFEQEHCPDELKLIAEDIVRMCRGIPLLVTLIGKMLGSLKVTSERMVSFWESVAEGISVQSTLSNSSLYFMVAYFSYSFLPYYLQPCFLYVACLSPNCDIHASRIIKLWIAEGFVIQTGDSCPEDLAEEYLQTLADKKLIVVSREGPSGKVKSFQVHSLLVILCMTLTGLTNFSQNIRLEGPATLEKTMIMRPMGAIPLTQSSEEVGQSVRSLLTNERPSLSLAGGILKFRLLRVLDVFQLQFYKFPMEILELVLMRYLAFSCYSNLPPSISLLCNLQTLIIRRLPSFRAFSLPSELWEMSQLRHVNCKETVIWYYPRTGKKAVRCNLQTLSCMQLAGVTSAFLENIQSIRKLGIFCNITSNSFTDLACLHNLEKLKCSTDWSLASRNFLSYLKFPPSLRKLTLSLCRIPLRIMKEVGFLRNLEELKLHNCDFLCIDMEQTEPEWETTEGEFPKLLSLTMVDLNLVHWKAHSTHFPRLQHLIIQNCYAMVEIPFDIGEIQNLERIEVNKRSTPSFIASAEQIKEKQSARGNVRLQVHIIPIW